MQTLGLISAVVALSAVAVLNGAVLAYVSRRAVRALRLSRTARKREEGSFAPLIR